MPAARILRAAPADSAGCGAAGVDDLAVACIWTRWNSEWLVDLPHVACSHGLDELYSIGMKNGKVYEDGHRKVIWRSSFIKQSLPIGDRTIWFLNQDGSMRL